MKPPRAARGDPAELSRVSPPVPMMAIVGEGLVLGSTVLVPLFRDDLGLADLVVTAGEQRILAPLAVAYGKAVGPDILSNIRRAVREWRHGELCLAQIHLVRSGLPRLADAETASSRLILADRLLAAGIAPRDLIKACGLDPAPIDLLMAGYDPDQPRVPPGNPDGGQWTPKDTSSAATAAQPNAEFVEYKPVGGMPDDAIAVTPPDGETIEDTESKTKKLMAPPPADYRQVYAAGRTIASLPLVSQVPAIRAAVAQGGIYDFQRDPTEGLFYDVYTNASNYAVGVFMSGAGHSLSATKAAAEAYALFYSSNYGSRKPLYWIGRGWKDAAAGRWQ
jgi:hypothetical protein